MNSITTRTSAQAMIRARNQRSDHFTISFHFFTFSSSPTESVIRSPPYTIAPIARSPRSVAILVVQLITCVRKPQVRDISPAEFTRSVPLRQLSNCPQTLHHSDHEQVANEVWGEKKRETTRIKATNTIEVKIFIKSNLEGNSRNKADRCPGKNYYKYTHSSIDKALQCFWKFLRISPCNHESCSYIEKHPNCDKHQKSKNNISQWCKYIIKKSGAISRCVQHISSRRRNNNIFRDRNCINYCCECQKEKRYYKKRYIFH